MAEAKRDNNQVTTLLAVSSSDGTTPITVYVDPTTHRLYVDAVLTGGGTSMTDDAAFTPGTTSITPMGAFFDDVAPDSVNEGDAGVVRMSANRNLYITIRDAAGNERGLNIDASGQLAATVTGNVAHDAADSGNPVKVGGKASGALPTAVAANDRVDSLFDLQGRFIIAQKAATPTQSSVAGSASSVSLLAANTARLGATISNDSTAALYLKLGATASTSSYTIKLLQDDYYEVPFGYTGAIDGIWASATGNARITELT